MVRRWASPSLQDAPCFHASKQHASRSLSENGKYAKNDQEGLKRSYHSFMSLEDFWKTLTCMLSWSMSFSKTSLCCFPTRSSTCLGLKPACLTIQDQGSLHAKGAFAKVQHVDDATWREPRQVNL